MTRRPPPAIPTHVNPLTIRRALGRREWRPPIIFGPCGWKFLHVDEERGTPIGSIIVTTSELHDAEAHGDWTDWTHASWSWLDRVPTYAELMLLKAAVWPTGEAYQIHPAPSDHVNLNPYALHLWGRADGARVLPSFSAFGTI